jgi:type III pantothenate kinase
MNLVIDIGNTSVKIGVFNEGELVFNKSYLPDQTAVVGVDLEKYSIERVAFCAVAALPAAIESLISGFANRMEIHSLTPTPLINSYLTPETLGVDRLVNAVGASFSFPDKNSLVIDTGTCLKFDLVEHGKNYCGGSISPGLQMRYKALHEFTDRLPLLAPVEEVPLVGQTTAGSIHSGVVNGMVAEISAIISEYKLRYENLHIILTGGDAHFFLNRIKTYIFADPVLTLRGLDAILRYNQ